MRKFSRDKIIDFVYEAWYNKNIITKEMIIKSLKIQDYLIKQINLKILYLKYLNGLMKERYIKLKILKKNMVLIWILSLILMLIN